MLAVLGVLVLLLAFAAACSPAPAEPTQAPAPTNASEQPTEAPEEPTKAPEPTEAPAAEPVDIRVTGIPGPAGQIIQDCAESFMAENPNIKVQVDIAGGAEDEYKPNFPQIAASDDRPDAAWYWVEGSNYPDMVEAGILEPLNDVWEKDGLYDAYPKPIIENYTSPDGNQYAGALEMIWFAPVYYNKAIFAEAGVEPPANGYYYETLDEWYAVADKLRAAGYEPLSVGTKDGWRLSHLHDQILQRMVTEDIYEDFLNNWKPGWDAKAHYNSAEWVDTDKMMKEWYDKGVLADGDVGRGFNEARALFTQGKAAMYQDGSWAVGMLHDEAPDLDLGWMLYPQIKSDITPAMLVYAGSGLMAPKAITPERGAAAKEYIAYCLSKDYQAKMAESGLAIPARTDVPKEAMANSLPMLVEMYHSLGDPLPTAFGWNTVVDTSLKERYLTLAQEMVTGQITPEEVGEQTEQFVEKLRSK